MDTNVQALKGLYAALNGDPKDVENMTTSSEVITAMEDVAAAAATELPVVKKVDAGKTLTVNGNGKWAAIMPESVIDDTEASATKTYSSSKIESLIPANELPTPLLTDVGKIAKVAMDDTKAVWTIAEDAGTQYLDITVGGTKASPNVNNNFSQIIASYVGGKIPRVKLTVSDLSDLNNFEMIFSGYCPARGSNVAYFTFMGYANTGADEVGLVSVKILDTQGWVPSASITIHTLS